MLNKTKQILTRLEALLVGFYGFYIIVSNLLIIFRRKDYFIVRYSLHTLDAHLLLGLGLVYLSLNLAKRKRNALILASIIALIVSLIDIHDFILISINHRTVLLQLIRLIVLPLLILGLLLFTASNFRVRSAKTNFISSLKTSFIVIAITIVYGILGFMLIDKSDFHQEISFFSALKHTIDQFLPFGNSSLVAYTRRAKLFLASLEFMGPLALIYSLVSLFRPVSDLLADQSARNLARQLLIKYGSKSEDFFKLYPEDKNYYFSRSKESFLAYKVKHRQALVVADPAGKSTEFKTLIRNFLETAATNDWQVSLIHTDQQYLKMYQSLGFNSQLIGQEAVVDCQEFITKTIKNKYFRNIINRFEKDNYVVEILNPPHDIHLLLTLKQISDDWLSKPGRVERGFVMGYFNNFYLNQCQIAVVKDASEQIVGFLNILPTESYSKEEASYDLLRNANSAPANALDYLLARTICLMAQRDYKYFNLGLSPLVGVSDSDSTSLINRVLKFSYDKGDYFYSFEGLRRFKNKYQPVWQDKYIIYNGGISAFSKTLSAVLQAMRIK